MLNQAMNTSLIFVTSASVAYSIALSANNLRIIDVLSAHFASSHFSQALTILIHQCSVIVIDIF